jgi:hypothetical protein
MLSFLAGGKDPLLEVRISPSFPFLGIVDMGAPHRRELAELLYIMAKFLPLTPCSLEHTGIERGRWRGVIPTAEFRYLMRL